MRLKSKSVIITGAGGNIGLATARRFHAEGANLTLVDRDEAALDALRAELPDERVAFAAADVTVAADNARVVETAREAHGGIDVFFGNAGIEGTVRPFEEYPEDTFEAVMKVNVTALQLGIAAVLPAMSEGGSIVLTSSIAGMIGSAGNVAYSTSKHAVIGLMRSAAAAAGPRGIRVNSVHPGYVDSTMFRRLVAQNPDPGFLDRLVASSKLGRLVTLDEVAAAVLFLASDDSSAITSQTLVVDAGVVN